MREAVLTYKKTLEVEDNVSLTASAGYTFNFPTISPEDPSDVLLGYRIVVHEDSDPVGDLPPYSADLRITVDGSLGGAYGERPVSSYAWSYSGTPDTYFVHVTITAIYAVVS